MVLDMTPAAEEKRRPSGGARHPGAERACHIGQAIIVHAFACRLVRVGGIEAAEITRGEAALDDEGTGTENRSSRRHGELLGEGGVARSANRKELACGLV